MRREGDFVVGRTYELGVLNGILDATSAGSPNVVFLSGEPGIGKTHVLAELARRSDQRGYLVLAGSAAEFEEELPFGVVIDALDAYIESLESRVVDRLAVDGLEELADVFPSLRTLRSATRTTVASERFRSYFAVRELLERLAAKQPLLLVLDDLHWADLASIELVSHLLRRPPDARVLLAGSFRTGQAAPGLTTAIDAAHRAAKVARLELGPLGPDEAGQLLAGTDRARHERLYRESGGNPFYMLQLARAAGDGPIPQVIEPDQVPGAVVASISQELTALPSSVRSFAEAAAVVGDPFEVDIAAVTADVDVADALAFVDQLIDGDLLRPASVPRRFAFRHPIVRAAVYQSSSTATRLTAHARCGDALAVRGAAATTRAHHVEQSAPAGDVDAVTLLTDAGHDTAQRLPATAARWFQAALRLLPGNAPTEARVELLNAAASALTTAGRLSEARAALVEGLELVEDPASKMRIGMTAACANVEQQLGRPDEAHARLVTVLDHLADRNSAAGVSLMVSLSTDGFYQMRFDTMKEWAGAAVVAASAIERPELTAAAEAALAAACSFMGETAQAEEHCLVAAQIIDSMPDHQLAMRVDTVANLVGAELNLERYEDTARHAARGIAVARSAGRDDVFPSLIPCLGTATRVLGRLDESAAVLDDAVEAARLSPNVLGLAWTLFNRALTALVQGDLEVAYQTAKESVEVAGPPDKSFVAAWAGVVLACVLYERGEPAQAAELMVSAGGGPGLERMPGGWRVITLEVLVRCWLALGRVDDARAAAEAALALAEKSGLPWSQSAAERAAAEIALYIGDVDVAVDRASASIAAAEGVSARAEAAEARILLGRALATAGNRADAVATLERAAAELDSLAAIRLRDQAEQELRKLGQRVHRRSEQGQGRYGVLALSGREMEVARLVVDRRTNVEIAGDLFLSLKTVESHLRNIFRKLEVSSRVEVARMIEREAPPTPSSHRT